MNNNKLNHLIGRAILDVPCLYCGEEVDTYQYDTDETDFSYDSTGHYYVNYHCKKCNKNFRVYFEFEYKITKATY